MTMKTPPHHESQQPDVSLGNMQTPPSRLTFNDSKRVCFYKSGDPQFSEHWVVINSRTFKTFDALLVALSNKVPLPFGVRTITTPKGTHAIQSLEDLQHGASYVCSDQRKVKPLNLDEINQRHVPQNSTRPINAGHHGAKGLIRQLIKKNEVGRTAKMAEGSMMPRRLVVFKNRDPSTKRIVVLQKRTAPTFEALLEYLSQVMNFPVIKLYTTDGRRVEGLPTLELCSGVLIAAGNEPFQLANFNIQASTYPSHSVMSESTGPRMTQPLLQVKRNSDSSKSRSRNFSLSPERHFVNQINMSLKGRPSEENEVKVGLVVMKDQALDSEKMEKYDFMSDKEGNDRLIIPSENEIEKSCRVNQDGSMTVEMKVRLTIQQEEMIRWSTTVSRACVNNQEMTASSQPVSTFNKNNIRTTKSNIDSYESNDENAQTYKPIKLNKDRENDWGSASSEALEKITPCFRRPPTPGPRRVRRKKPKVENIKNLSQESAVGTYSYVEQTAEGELLKGYSVVSHSGSSSTKPVPKPRKKHLGKANHNKTYSSVSGMAEVLQLHKGIETKMHIHQSQDICENYFAETWNNEADRLEFRSQKHKNPDSTESGPQSSNNECDTDLTRPSAISGSGISRNKKFISLLSGQLALSETRNNNASSFTDYENQARCESSDKEVEPFTEEDSEKMMQQSERSIKNVFLKSTVKEKKKKACVPDFLKGLKNRHCPELQSCTESDKYRQKIKKRKNGQSPEKVNTGQSNILSDTYQNINLSCTDTHLIKEKVDIILLSHSAPFKILTRQRSVNGSITRSHKEGKKLRESMSMPMLHSSPGNVHQCVENWLENVHLESVPYMDELSLHESRARFQIKSDFSESDKVVEGSTVENPVCQRLVQFQCKGEPVETLNLRGYCKSMSSVGTHTAEQEIGTRKYKSSADMVPKLPDVPNAQNSRSGMKHILEQLRLSIQDIIKACSQFSLSSLKTKKSSRHPDFSSQLASIFGSPSKALLSFLTVVTLRDIISSWANDISGSTNDINSGSEPEALKVLKSIQKLTSIEDEEELKAKLASLYTSISVRLKKSWRDFQEKYNIKENPLLSPRQSEQEFAIEFNSEQDDQYKGHIYGIREVMDELHMCENLRREISSLVRGDLTHFLRARSTKEHLGHDNETTSVACENKAASVKGDPGGFLDKEKKYFEESQYNNIANTKSTKESEELHLLESSSHNPALLSKKLAIEENMANHNRVIMHVTNILDDVKTNQEKYGDNEVNKAELCEEKQEMMNNVQIIEEKYTGGEISQDDEFQVTNYFPTKLEDKVECRETVGYMQSESKLYSPTSEIEVKEIKSNTDMPDITFIKMGDCIDSFKGCSVDSKEENTNCETRMHPQQSDVISVASEADTVEAYLTNNSSIQPEERNSIHDRSEASSFSVDEVDPHSDFGNSCYHLETMCSTSERRKESETEHELQKSEDESVNEVQAHTAYMNNEEADEDAKPYHSSVSNKVDEQSDHDKSGSWIRRELEAEHELQDESVIEVQAHDNNEDADVDEDFDAEPNPPVQLLQEAEYSDSYKCQDALAELYLQTLEESVSKTLTHAAEEKDHVVDEHDDNLSNALDTDKVLDIQSPHCYLDATKDFLSRKSCNSEDTERIEETAMDHEWHCQHPNVFPQQLLDFVNLALRSSAWTLPYDSNGCLRIAPDRSENREISLSKSNIDNHHARCLPSPNTSDLSDYRPDTTDSGGNLSLLSTDLMTESGEDEAERRLNYQDNPEQSSANIRKSKTLHNASNGPTEQPVCCSSSDSIGNSELEQCLAFHAKTDYGEGILIDKGRWLLKENHLIRNSPPVPVGMYENVDTTSTDTGQENTSEDATYIPYGRKQSPFGVISSSDLEDMAKPSIPRCTYFNMTHSSDSDPFLDNQSITNSNKGRVFIQKSKEVSPLGETSKMLSKKIGNLSSFSSVELKLGTGKVHPEVGMASCMVEKSARSQSIRCNTPLEEESVESLSLKCGQHCIIL